MKFCRHLLGLPFWCLLFCFADGSVRAPAQVSLAYSPDTNWLLKVTPGTFPHGVEDDTPRKKPEAQVYQFDPIRNAYVHVRTFSLLNEYAPKTSLISDNGQFVVTLDDWEPEVGRTDNAIVVYRGTGELVRRWNLEAFLTPDDLKYANRPMINSLGRYWRGERANFTGLQDLVLIFPLETRDIGTRYLLDVRKLSITPQVVLRR